MSLKIESLDKKYINGVHALNDFSIEIKPGMFGILGPNGAGKSTLMRIISTLQLPDAGNVFFKNIDVLKHPIELRKKLGYLPQSFGVYPKKSAESLLHYFATLKGISSKKDRIRKVEEVLQVTNLYENRKNHVSGFSGGMKQRFGIAQMLLNDPELIVVDEPTSGLDPAERRRFLNVLREIGITQTVLFSTHLVEDVEELCTDLAIINQGQLLLQSSPSQVIRSIEGTIWKATIDASQKEMYQDKYTILSSKYGEMGELILRIHAPQQQEDFWTPATPTLEDVYFSILQNQHAQL